MLPFPGVPPTPADGAGSPPASSTSLVTSFPSDSGARAQASAPELYIPLSAVPAPPGTTDAAWRRKLARMAERSRRARKLRGRWHLHRDDLLDGVPVHKHLRAPQFARAGAPAPARPVAGLPAGSGTWSSADHERYQRTRLLVRGFDAFAAARPGRRAALAAAYAAAAARDVFADPAIPPSLTVADYCAQHNLSCTYASLRRYARRLQTDGNVDRRGRGGAGPAPAGPTCTPAAWDYFCALWLTPQQRTVALCWEITRVESARRGWAWPALRTIQLRVQRELPAFHADYYRLGPTAWARQHSPRIQRDLSPIRPNERWVGDHARFDFLCLDEQGRPVRPWLTAWQEQRSRLLVGWQITTRPDSNTIIAAFRAGVLQYGAPAEVIIDNGKDYRAAGFSGGKARKIDRTKAKCASVLGRLDVRARFCIPFEPGSKAIESWFGTLHERYDKLHDSYCGRDPQHRPEDLYARLRRGGVELPTLPTVRQTFARYVAAFHQRPHSGDGMAGQCPQHVFDHCDPLPRRTLPRAQLDELLKKTVVVKVSKRGVRYQGVYYGQGEARLRTLHGQQVQLALDPEHAEYVDVRDLQGRHLLRAYQQRLDGLTQESIAEAKRRQAAARRQAKTAGRAWRDAHKSVVELALEHQAAHAAELRQAAGAEHAAPPPRAFALLPTDSHFAPAPPVAEEPPEEPLGLTGPADEVDEDWPAIGTEFAFEEEVEDDPGLDELLGRLGGLDDD